MLVTKFEVFKRHTVTLLIVLQYITGKCLLKIELLGHLFYHLTVYSGKCGYIEVGVEDSKADGRLRLIHHDEYRQIFYEEINFRIFNRWLVRNMFYCPTQLLWQIKTEMATREGLNVHSVIWGRHPHRAREVKPFDLSRLPGENIIAERNARLKKFQDWMANHFPSRPETTNAPNNIVFQWETPVGVTGSYRPLIGLKPLPEISDEVALANESHKEQPNKPKKKTGSSHFLSKLSFLSSLIGLSK